MSVPCPSCGAPGVGGLEGCRERMGRMGVREFSDPAYFAVHRLTVDAYCLQHPEQYMVSSKSAAAHLAGMCWSMEKGRTVHMPAPLKRWVDGARSYARVEPPPPGRRGEVTILSMLDPVDAQEYERRAMLWARSAWEAWSAHHDQARAWVQEALSARR